MTTRRNYSTLGRPGEVSPTLSPTAPYTFGCCGYFLLLIFVAAKFGVDGFVFLYIVTVLTAFYYFLTREGRLYRRIRNLITGAKKNLLYDFDRMDGISFENACVGVLRANGYRNIRTTRTSGDYGVDILCDDGGRTYAVQCKRFTKNVGVKAVQEAESGCHFYNRDRAVVMTNSYFTSSAMELASRNGVILIDREKLFVMCNSAGRGKSVAEARELLHTFEKLFRSVYHQKIKIPTFVTHFSELYIRFDLSGKAEKLEKYTQKMANKTGVCYELSYDDDGWHLIITKD